MPDPPPDEPVTVELERRGVSTALEQRETLLRDALPGLEAEREVTDWGRSERLSRVADRTLLRFLYHYWFRVEADGLENVPTGGGALLLANRSGRLPLDASMIAKAVGEAPPGHRELVPALHRTYAGAPLLGMGLTKLGAVSAHPANLHRLLFDERRLVLVFPEGPRASSKPLRWRYRLRRFTDPTPLEAAIRARVPVVPVAVVGAEEAVPALRLPLARLSVGGVVPLPAKFRLRFLQPVETDRFTERGREPDRATVAELGEGIRSLIQENLLELVGERRSVWLG